ncbi:MAG: carbon monoxide dehydrogenase [Deltaproteobacteria bacterium]|nr:carbon monoxide dehydrogenase [Deltaproteobacteria bacterium]
MITFYRRLPRLDYQKPANLRETLELLDENREGQYLLYAGGTDVIPKLKARIIKPPKVLVDLKGIKELDFITYDENSGLRIGALATISSLLAEKCVKMNYPALFQGAKSIASSHIQNRATVIGNICNAVPSADSAPALLCLGAKVVCVSKMGERTIELDQFFLRPNKTCLQPGEIVKEIQVPPVTAGTGGAYIKLSPRSRMDLAVVGVAAMVQKNDGAFSDIRIGLGAVAPKPMRSTKAEERLRGETISEKMILEAAKIAAQESDPIDDHRASAMYRRMMVEVLVKRAIQQALLVGDQ